MLSTDPTSHALTECSPATSGLVTSRPGTIRLDPSPRSGGRSTDAPSGDGSGASLPPFAPDPGSERLSPEDVFEAGLRHHHVANTAYPIAHRKTIWAYRVARDRHLEVLRPTFEAIDQMSLYAHIPFCERRCAFCEYTVVERHDADAEQSYHEALLRELDLATDRLGLERIELVGFDIGGGTPALMSATRTAELVDRVVSRFRLGPAFEISIETTPKLAALDPARLRAIRATGIERISMGMQMVNAKLLRAYGRELHRPGYNRRAVDHIRAAGFRRFNIDLMYGFARQTGEDFEATLRAAVALEPDVITLYRMRYKGTRIAGEAHELSLEQAYALYAQARRVLLGAGYLANPGKNTFSRIAAEAGTSAYLTARVVHSVPYLGLGLGAQSFTNNLLGYNEGAASKRLGGYLRAVRSGRLPLQDLYQLPLEEGMAKMVAVSMYFGEIDLGAFLHRFGVALDEHFAAEVAFVKREGLMQRCGGKLRLTPKGVRTLPGVIALFYSPVVQRHLLERSEAV